MAGDVELFKGALRGFKPGWLDFVIDSANMKPITLEVMMKSGSRYFSYAARAVLCTALTAGVLGAAPAAWAQDATIHQVYEAAEAGKFIEAQKMMDQVL